MKLQIIILLLIHFPFIGKSQIKLIADSYIPLEVKINKTISDSIQSDNLKAKYSANLTGTDILSITGIIDIFPEENFGELYYVFELVNEKDSSVVSSSPERISLFQKSARQIKDSVDMSKVREGTYLMRWKFKSSKKTILQVLYQTTVLVIVSGGKITEDLKISYNNNFIISPSGIPYASSGFYSSGSSLGSKGKRHKNKSVVIKFKFKNKHKKERCFRF